VSALFNNSEDDDDDDDDDDDEKTNENCSLSELLRSE